MSIVAQTPDSSESLDHPVPLADPGPLITSGPYRPRVLDARRFGRVDPEQAPLLAHGGLLCYSLHGLQDAAGEFRVGADRFPLGDLTVLLVPPDTPFQTSISRMRQAWYIHFLVRHEADWPVDGFSRAYHLYRAGRPDFLQPSPLATWGRELATGADPDLARRIYRLGNRVVTAWMAGGSAGASEAHLLLGMILSHWVLRSSSQQRPAAERRLGEHIDEVLAWSLEHLGEGLTVKQMAERVGLERAQFSRLFSERFGLGPGTWLRYQRLLLACRLLRRPHGLPVGSVATATGYADATSFGRSFARHTGLTPEAYRRQGPGPVDFGVQQRLSRRLGIPHLIARRLQ